MMVFLLKARCTPVGWEMADVDNPLGRTVDLPEMYAFHLGDRVCGTVVSITTTPTSVVIGIEED
jgi:hypothetical protein